MDRLTIVSHDRFQEIIDHANDPNSIIRTGIVIGRDIPDAPTKAVTIEPVFMTQLGLAIPPATSGAGLRRPQPAPTITEPERKTAELTMQVIRQQFERLARSGDLKTAGRSAAHHVARDRTDAASSRRTASVLRSR